MGKIKKLTLTPEQKSEFFKILVGLGANHHFWHNGWMFTRPVFTMESRTSLDDSRLTDDELASAANGLTFSSVKFWDWVEAQPAVFRKFICDEAVGYFGNYWGDNAQQNLLPALPNLK